MTHHEELIAWVYQCCMEMNETLGEWSDYQRKTTRCGGCDVEVERGAPFAHADDCKYVETHAIWVRWVDEPKGNSKGEVKL